jgi:hypothetical protein
MGRCISNASHPFPAEQRAFYTITSVLSGFRRLISKRKACGWRISFILRAGWIQFGKMNWILGAIWNPAETGSFRQRPWI